MYVGDVTDVPMRRATDANPTAQLVNHTNFKNIDVDTVYTSLGDFDSKENFVSFLESADRIVYCPEQPWSSKDLETETVQILMYLHSHKDVVGPLPTLARTDNMLELADSRKTTAPQLWIVGCSVSHGVGVDVKNRYGALLADQLNLECSFLTQPGSSIAWAADQILRSDLRPGDIVVWGLTTDHRFPHYSQKYSLRHITVKTYSDDPLLTETVDVKQILDTENLLYYSVTAINRVINMCQKINVKLVLAGVIVTEDLLPMIYDLPSYLHLNRVIRAQRYDRGYFDLGTDGEHPGPITHRWYADKVLEFIKK